MYPDGTDRRPPATGPLGSYEWWLKNVFPFYYDPPKSSPVGKIFGMYRDARSNTCRFAVCGNKDTKDWACWLQMLEANGHSCQYRHKKQLTYTK